MSYFLTHFRPMFPFYTPWKLQKTSQKTSENQRFSDVFMGYRKGTVAWNGLKWLLSIFFCPPFDQFSAWRSKIFYNSLHHHQHHHHFSPYFKYAQSNYSRMSKENVNHFRLLLPGYTLWNRRKTLIF